MTADSTIVSLVNVSPVETRTLVIQAGGYGEHQFMNLTMDNRSMKLDSMHLVVRLEPGCGARLTFGTRRYANQPTLAMPWDLTTMPTE